MDGVRLQVDVENRPEERDRDVSIRRDREDIFAETVLEGGLLL
jgi:hypothetical protein